jgi:Zn-dependent metalloprotease
MRKALAVGSTAVLAAGLSAYAITGATATPSPRPVTFAAASASAEKSLAAHRPDVFAASGDAYQVQRVITDANGGSHVRYNRTYKGLAVLGGDFVIHTNPDGTYDGASVAQVAPLTLDITPTVKPADAAAAARKVFSGTVAKVGTPKLEVDAANGPARLVFETLVTGTKPDKQTPSKLHVFTDAKTGAVTGKHDAIETVAGSGNGIYVGKVSVDTTLTGGNYLMQDPSHGNGWTCDMRNLSDQYGPCAKLRDADNSWGNGTNGSRLSAAVDVHYGAAKTFDYYKSEFGRNGIFGNGKGVPSRVHFGDSYVNAFWDDDIKMMTYGDGQNNARPLTEIDVAGHEMSHGLSSNLAQLGYSGEVGGLNEGTSDIFGSMVEFYANNAKDVPDYNIGELINIFGDGTPLRYMYHPSLDGASVDCWSSNVQNLDPHYSSGVANHFYFMLAEGSGNTRYGNSPVCGAVGGVKGIGRDAAAKIWFKALDSYMVSDTKYKDTSVANNDARNWTIKAAYNLYGKCSVQYKAVQQAWTAVGVAGEDKVCPA